MNRPEIILSYPSFVVEFAIVDSSVTYTDRGNLNVGGEWLGEVPKLAICKEYAKETYFLAHCDNDWNILCLVEERQTIAGIKEIAESHYRGIKAKWIKTGYLESDAIDLYEKEKIENSCSFCSKNIYDDDLKQMIFGNKVKICDQCVSSFHEEMSGGTLK